MDGYEIDELLALKPTRPHVVSLACDDSDGDRAAKLAITFRQLTGILLQRHDRVAIAMDVEDGNLGFGQSFQAVDWIVPRQLGAELFFRQAVGARSCLEAGVTGQITDRVNPRDACHGGSV